MFVFLLGYDGPEILGTFDLRSRGPRFETYHWPINVHFPGNEKRICEDPFDHSVNWFRDRALSVQVQYSWAPYLGVGCMHTTRNEIVSTGIHVC